MGKYKRLILIYTLFSIAMAYVESAVVVYLRAMYYPDGFIFPMVEISVSVLLTEIGREIATIVMLWTIAKLAAKNTREFFAFFAFNFGIWDIWYYIWLKIFLNWPSSLLDWDVLFLIPLPWISPVLAPLLVSLALIVTAILILRLENKKILLRFSRTDWLLEITAGIIIIMSFLIQTTDKVPQYYPWWVFISALSGGFCLFLYRYRKS